MEIREVTPLPPRCLECEDAKDGIALGVGVDAYCYNCDYALDRFEIVKVSNIDEKRR
ncbi:hypothetical protein LJC34_02510 [Oscillospiraceae bacterium OttesenSCG-928-G22]|nr:hypothetical protein [Oscillospiraceae bacterium OttesenSCG-928-G22]